MKNTEMKKKKETNRINFHNNVVVVCCTKMNYNYEKVSLSGAICKPRHCNWNWNWNWN